jgi:hypothetical protein
MEDKHEKNERFESYPKPTETDQQLKNQPEYIDEFPGEWKDRNENEAPSTNVDLPKQTKTSKDTEE